MLLFTPCSKLPAPMLKRHKESPIPFGEPVAAVSMLKSRSAIRFFFVASLHFPINLPVQQSDAPKLWMICLSSERVTVTSPLSNVSPGGGGISVESPHEVVIST